MQTGTDAELEDEQENRWKLTGGKDIDGDDLDLVIAFKNGCVVVVTVF